MDPITQQATIAAAGAGGGDPVYVDDVFSTHLYTGTGSAQTITNGIELGSNVGVSLNGKTITDTAGGGADYSALNNDIFSSGNDDYYYGSIDCYIDYGSAVVSTFYDLAPQGDNSTGAIYNTPTSITGYGSNNASSWTSLGAVSFNSSDWAEGKFTRYHFPSNTTAYRYYRLTSSGTKSIQEWRLGITDSSLGEGGLVWIKRRDGTNSHLLYDTERGVNKYLGSNLTAGEYDAPNQLTAFANTGFSVGNEGYINGSGSEFASWTFRKAPGFFDVVTYTGSGSTQTISHSLGSVPGMIIVKRTSASEDWAVYHRSIGNASYLKLNDVQAAQGGTNTQWGQTTPTSSVFTLGGSDAMTNASGSSYVAYVFAHDAASFGTDGDESIIKCGSYTGSGSTDQTIDLGFEPQYILIKNTQVGQNWQEFDIMRGMISGNSLQFYPNLSHAEDSGTRIHPEANGFSFRDESSSRVNSSGNTFIYMAIRRPHKPPEVATEVFAMDTGNSSDTIPTFDSGFPVDFAIQTAYASTDDKFASARLIGAKYLKLNDKDAEANQTRAMFDSNVGWGTEWPSARLSWMFKRAPGFMDVVAYVGDNASNRAVPHNLEAVPELLIVKHRTGGTKDWHVYTQATGNQSDLRLNQNNSATTGFTYWASTTPTATHFYVSNVPAGDIVNQLDRNYIAILFATLPGISKVGSYTGTAATQNIDCGFTNGARFVLIKRTDGTGDWMLFDTTRGIVSGNDSNIWLNETDAAFASTDYIDPYSAGFTLTSENDTNGSSDEYIFLAIA